MPAAIDCIYKGEFGETKSHDLKCVEIARSPHSYSEAERIWVVWLLITKKKFHFLEEILEEVIQWNIEFLNGSTKSSLMLLEN